MPRPRNDDPANLKTIAKLESIRDDADEHIKTLTAQIEAMRDQDLGSVFCGSAKAEEGLEHFYNFVQRLKGEVRAATRNMGRNTNE